MKKEEALELIEVIKEGMGPRFRELTATAQEYLSKDWGWYVEMMPAQFPYMLLPSEIAMVQEILDGPGKERYYAIVDAVHFPTPETPRARIQICEYSYLRNNETSNR